MVTQNKALASLSISTTVVGFCLFWYQQLPDLLYISPVLVLYCLLDLHNSADMIIHHISTVLLNVTFWYINYNLQYLSGSEQQAISQIVTSFFMVEVSTIFLALLHLKYRNWLIKLLFVGSFSYYRVVSLSYVLYTHYQPRYLPLICQADPVCRFSWYLGCLPVLLLNYYWFGLIVRRVIRGKPKIKR